MPTAPAAERVARWEKSVGQVNHKKKPKKTGEQKQNDRKILLRGIKVERGERSMGAPGFP